jgi:hypothetical protein
MRLGTASLDIRLWKPVALGLKTMSPHPLYVVKSSEYSRCGVSGAACQVDTRPVPAPVQSWQLAADCRVISEARSTRAANAVAARPGRPRQTQWLSSLQTDAA